MQIQKSEKFVKAQDIKGAKVLFKIVEEPKEVEGNYGKKLETRVKMTVEDSGETAFARWSINNKSKDKMIDKFGSETADWIGQEVSVTVETINGKEAIITQL